MASEVKQWMRDAAKKINTAQNFSYEEDAAIVAAHAPAEDGWVKVSERLPDNEASVWVSYTDPCNPNFQRGVVAWYGKIDKKWHWLPEFIEAKDVTHWRPLPAPPGKEPA